MAKIKPTISQYISPLEGGQVRDGCSPYLQELALVVIAWNELHVELSQLFCVVAGFPNMTTGLQIWHSTENDRAQRKLLREALSGGLQHLRRVKAKGQRFSDIARNDIEFILNKVDSMSDARNNAIHSPYLFAIEGSEITMQSFDFFGSPRAKKLSGKDLLVEFRRQTETATMLSAFSQNLRLGLYLVPDPGWPERPTLPAAGRVQPQKHSVKRKSK
jgi:hypothetical protein